MSLDDQPSANDDPSADGEEINLRATYAGAKRRIAALEEQLKALQEVGTKKKS